MSYTGLLPEDYSFAKNLAEQRKNNALKVTNPVKANAAVGNPNLKGMQLKRGMMKDSLKIQELREAGRIGEAGQLSQVVGSTPSLKIGETLSNLKDQVGTAVTQTVQDLGQKTKDLLKIGNTTKDATAAAKIFDGTPKGTQLGLNAIALGATLVEKWGQRFAKKKEPAIGSGVNKTVALHPGLVDDEYV